jgi:hypothetical protein
MSTPRQEGHLIDQDEEVPYGDIPMGKLTAMHWRHIGRAEGRNDLRRELRQAYREELGAAVGVTIHNTEPASGGVQRIAELEQDADAHATIAEAIANNQPPF